MWSIIGKRPKLIELILMDSNSGLKARTATMRSSGVMFGAPLGCYANNGIALLVDLPQDVRNNSGSMFGLPLSESRACRCAMAALALVAATASAAI